MNEDGYDLAAQQVGLEKSEYLDISILITTNYNTNCEDYLTNKIHMLDMKFRYALQILENNLIRQWSRNTLDTQILVNIIVILK